MQKFKLFSLLALGVMASTLLFACDAEARSFSSRGGFSGRSFSSRSSSRPSFRSSAPRVTHRTYVRHTTINRNVGGAAGGGSGGGMLHNMAATAGGVVVGNAISNGLSGGHHGGHGGCYSSPPPPSYGYSEPGYAPSRAPEYVAPAEGQRYADDPGPSAYVAHTAQPVNQEQNREEHGMPWWTPLKVFADIFGGLLFFVFNFVAFVAAIGLVGGLVWFSFVWLRAMWGRHKDTIMSKFNK